MTLENPPFSIGNTVHLQMEDFLASHVRDFGFFYFLLKGGGSFPRDRHFRDFKGAVVPRAGRYITGKGCLDMGGRFSLEF